jgi:arylsulfatase A-like enzyme
MKPLRTYLLACFVASWNVAAADQMNLLIIQTDEHHFNTLGCYGGEIVKTPHIDWIADNGARCTSFYATTPVCSPSRASLVSGLYPQKTPVTQNNIPLNDAVVTFAEILRRNGYATGYAGKWHLDGAGKPQWAPTRTFGFEDNRFMFNRGHWKKFEDTDNGPRVGGRNGQGQPNYDLDGADEKTFSTDWLCDKAIAFISKNRAQPFCYMLSLPDPHGPNTVRAPYDTMYEHVDIKLPATLTRTPSQIPNWGKPAGVRPRQLRQLMRKYYGMVKCIDDNVGKILETLREHHLINKTMIVFTSDHGDLCGEHGRLNKGVPYEGSARIPFLMVCPGKVPPKTQVDEALTCIDFLPTAMSLLGITVPHDVDGRDASQLFSGQEADWEDVALVRSTSTRTPWISVITKRFKLVYSTVDQPWLVDLRNDPHEVSNLWEQPEHAKLVRDLTTWLNEYGVQHNDAYLRHPRIREQLDRVLN